MASTPAGVFWVPAVLGGTAVEVHSIPCKTTYSGPARVSSFFAPEAEGDHLKASFRGRSLRGKTVPLPEGFSGAFPPPSMHPASSSAAVDVTPFLGSFSHPASSLPR